MIVSIILSIILIFILFILLFIEHIKTRIWLTLISFIIALFLFAGTTTTYDALTIYRHNVEIRIDKKIVDGKTIQSDTTYILKNTNK